MAASERDPVPKSVRDIDKKDWKPRQTESGAHLSRRFQKLMRPAGVKMVSLMRKPQAVKDEAMAALGALGGAVSGAKNAAKLNASMTRTERRKSARAAAKARWRKKRGGAAAE